MRRAWALSIAMVLKGEAQRLLLPTTPSPSPEACPPLPFLPSPSSPQPRGHFPLETCSWEKGLASALSCQMVHGNKERGLEPLHCPTMGHFQREPRKVMG